MRQKLIEKGQWQWKSNSDPWSKSEDPQWTSYSHEQNYLIEKAYFDQQKEVEIGDYIVSIKDLIQRKKRDASRQRPIRRTIMEEENYLREERYFETELPKTINRVFRSLQDFLNFFKNRNPEIREFANMFNDVETKNDISKLNEKILPCLVDCIHAEAMKIPNHKEEEKLLPLFQTNLDNVGQLYSHVLRAYTIGSFLFQNMDLYLRNEDWAQLDSLLPYVYCLFKAFFCRDLASKQNNLQIGDQKVLYRGASLDESTHSFYDLRKVHCFSWNSVTSTTRKSTIAEKFMDRTYQMESKKYPTMFIIEIPISAESESEYLKWIDISRFSKNPAEEEVILPPGSIFEIVDISEDQDERTNIRLRLVPEIKSLAYQGFIMQGAMLPEMMTERETKVICLEGEELTEALKYLSGNQLVQEIEFCLCRFEKRSLWEMMKTLSTMQRLEKLKFLSCLYNDDADIKNSNTSEFCSDQKDERKREIKRLNLSKVEIFETNRFYKLLSLGIGDFKHCILPNSLEINFRKSLQITDEEVKKLCSEGIQQLVELASLKLDLSSTKLTNEGVNNLCSFGLQSLTQLTSLSINFSSCEKITDEGIESLCSQGLKYLPLLTSLNLNFSHCEEITDEALNNLSGQMLRSLTQLTSLTLDFSYCDQITDKGIDHLFQLQNLSNFKSSDFNFEGCYEVTKFQKKNNIKGFDHLASKISVKRNLNILESAHCNQPSDSSKEFANRNLVLECQVRNEDAKNICIQDLQHQTELKSLKLSFADWGKITDEEVNNLCSQALKYLSSLTSLDLDFSSSKEITDEGIRNLCSQGLKYLAQLTTLSLDFASCKGITNEGIDNLCSQGLEYLSKLTSLDLNFSNCEKLTDEGMCSQKLQYLTKLTTLKFNFGKSQYLTDEGLYNLSLYVLKNLTCLRSLTLDFSGCSKITDKGINKLGLRGLQNLTSLSFLSLNFKKCSNITDKGIEYLCSEGLQSLTKLESLELNFAWCHLISDKGIEALSSEGLKHLTQLKSQNLSFKRCSKITNEGVKNLCFEGLRYWNQLEFLCLNFGWCSKITDEGIDILCSQGRRQSQLKSLDLSFAGCSNITNIGVNTLVLTIIKKLISLTSLSLSFEESSNVDSFTMTNMIKVLRYFGFIEETL